MIRRFEWAPPPEYIQEPDDTRTWVVADPRLGGRFSRPGRETGQAEGASAPGAGLINPPREKIAPADGFEVG